MLLTGFDAPVEQVMFLDKPLQGAKLLQAIMRTNRPYPEKDKDRGIIVDYWGVFDRLQAAFAEFSPEDVELAVLDLQTLEDASRSCSRRRSRSSPGCPWRDEYEQMMWLLKRFMRGQGRRRARSRSASSAVQSAYETLAPDPALLPHLDDYRRLVRLRALWRRGARLDEARRRLRRPRVPPADARARPGGGRRRAAASTSCPIYRIDGSTCSGSRRCPGVGGGEGG